MNLHKYDNLCYNFIEFFNDLIIVFYDFLKYKSVNVINYKNNIYALTG